MIQVKQIMSYDIQCCNCSVVTIYGTYNVIALFMLCSCWNVGMNSAKCYFPRSMFCTSRQYFTKCVDSAPCVCLL